MVLGSGGGKGVCGLLGGLLVGGCWCFGVCVWGGGLFVGWGGCGVVIAWWWCFGVVGRGEAGYCCHGVVIAWWC